MGIHVSLCLMAPLLYFFVMYARANLTNTVTVIVPPQTEQVIRNVTLEVARSAVTPSPGRGTGLALCGFRSRLTRNGLAPQHAQSLLSRRAQLFGLPVRPHKVVGRTAKRPPPAHTKRLAEFQKRNGRANCSHSSLEATRPTRRPDPPPRGFERSLCCALFFLTSSSFAFSLLSSLYSLPERPAVPAPSLSGA